MLHEIASKKYNFTRLGKIIGQVETVLRIKEDMICKLLSEL
jgi:DNA-binding FrmR family transcriptional regulator